MNFSNMKNTRIPLKISNEMSVVIPASADSGIRCRNASPINTPAERLTKRINILFNNFLLIDNAKIPTNEIILITITLRIV